jgi:hypothetical protein
MKPTTLPTVPPARVRLSQVEQGGGVFVSGEFARASYSGVPGRGPKPLRPLVVEHAEMSNTPTIRMLRLLICFLYSACNCCGL